MSSSSDTVDILLPGHAASSERAPAPLLQVLVDVAGLSHPGHVRPNNEDHFYVARFGRFLETLGTNLPRNELSRRYEETGFGMVVADGIGGSAAGEVASRLAISTLVHLALATPDWIMRLDEDLLDKEVKLRAKERYRQIGEVMAEQAQDDPSLRGFGTTMTMALSLGKDLLVVHIGDSRAYLLRRGALHQLTRDHTLAQALVEGGVITPQEVSTHRMRHVLTKSLGATSGAKDPDIQEIRLQDGDGMLLCTDGLTEMVPEPTIAAIMGREETAEEACRRLVDEALKAGGKDNVTVIVARYALPQEEPDKTK